MDSSSAKSTPMKKDQRESISLPMKNLTLQEPAEFSSRFLSDYEPVRRLGRGGFGIVFEARDKLVDVNYAVKRIPLPSQKKPREKVMFEVRSHAHFDHQHIVRYYKTWLEAPPVGWQSKTDVWLAEKTGSSISDPAWTSTYSDCCRTWEGLDEEESSSGGIHFAQSVSMSEDASVTTTLCSESLKTCNEEPTVYLYISMELCPKGTLKDWMDVKEDRKPEVVNKFFRQICTGVAYIHRQALIHRDLKPTNIYLSEDNCIKIGDFGLTTQLCQQVSSPGNDKQKKEQSHGVGTRMYMAPEMVQAGLPYDSKVDIYSLGVILLEMLIPFNTEAERSRVLSIIKESPALLLRYPERLGLPWSLLLHEMLDKNPMLRPDACQVLRDGPKTPKPKSSR